MSMLRSRGPLAILELVFELGVGIVALLTLVTDSNIIRDLWAYISKPYLLAFVMMAAVVWSGFDSGKWRVWTPDESKAAGWAFRDGFWLGVLLQVGLWNLVRLHDADAATWTAHLSLAVTLVPLISRVTPPPPHYQPPQDRISPVVGAVGTLILVAFFLTRLDLLRSLVALYGLLLVALAGVYIMGNALFHRSAH